MANATTKTSAETATKLTAEAQAAASEAIRKGQENVYTQIDTAEKVVNAFIETQSAFYKANDTVIRHAYANYVSNVAATFEGIKALNRSADLNEFYSQSMENVNKAVETATDQYKGITKLVASVSKDASEVSQAAFAKVVA